MKSFRQLREDINEGIISSVARGAGKVIGGTAKLATKTAIAPVKIGARLVGGVAKVGLKTAKGLNKSIRTQGQQAVHAQQHSSYKQKVQHRKIARHTGSIVNKLK